MLENIEQAFLQLEFSIKLLTFIELGKIDKDEFDTDVTILGERSNIGLMHSSFHTYDDLIYAAHNNFNLTLGFSSILLESSLQASGIPNQPDDLSEDGMLRSLIYMIRCAYAHDMMHPKWSAKGPYQDLSFKLPFHGEIIEIRLAEKDGKSFDIQDIGGHEVYFHIKERALELIEKS